MNDVEVRQLRYFVAVAEELHFGRAAERLGMAQPPLSRAIRELERQLGVRLLERTTRQVALTPAGAALLHDARIALDAVQAAVRRARNAGRPEPALRVALKADFDAGLLPRILDEYRREPAALPVEVLLGGRGEQVPALHDGRADVALLPTPFDERGLDREPLLTEPRLVALPAGDPLAARTELCLADLAGHTLPNGEPADRESRDFAPPARQLDLAQIFNLIELGSMVLFAPLSVARRHPRPTIAYRPVRDLAPTTLTVAWPQDSHSPAVAAFVRVCAAVAADASVVTGPAERIAPVDDRESVIPAA
ncbi:LysR family transcriptional regulator [Actinoplanes teichomyceticus]|uniref:LysR family transcriptional regulator n=1 Tax=Actinoplanes teichomyceticus TaxID=1867 RepID=A0A561WSC6_ACTTI|nr:LysR family transcriptional regulator [Actinoplanes teichomyceticus]TWG26762.1 LysR family transcriptional regulator [Actinoplanes teichomyceticus]GIF15160.1 LysR family transcriptional regulator [Actinoplanes teichomyceticus]